ncbi:membrane fusion protein (multidrug efflux system) [Paraburkholderia sp. GAS199]|uniref:efflux RND transporter periplasmic adaptor subunit n=1 Tax=Paraburkholderia sp. GAS199 TaxID=3035126 RepID=UPI003D1A568C
MPKPFNPLSLRLISALAAISFVAACGDKPAAPPQQTPEVGVVTVKPTSVPVVVELPGRVSAFLVAQIISRVDGIVLKRDFVEGSEVKAGQRLYQIDPAPYIATLNSAKATLAKAQATLVSAHAEAERYKVLVAANAISKQDYDNAVATEGSDAADVASGKAAVDTAQINLGYTSIVAPITGRIGKSAVTPGAYVQASAATVLSTVQQLDPVYVDLTQSSLAGLKLRRDIQEGRLSVGGPNAAKVKLILEDGRAYDLPGKLEFSDITVDQTTGSVTVRATFPNPQRILLPGMFVRAQIEEGVNEKAIVVPQVGVTHDQKGNPTAMVVDADGKVALRQLVTSGTEGSNWIVESGLNEGDRVIVQGTSKVNPGMAVKTVEAQMPATPASAAQ